MPIAVSQRPRVPDRGRLGLDGVSVLLIGPSGESSLLYATAAERRRDSAGF